MIIFIQPFFSCIPLFSFGFAFNINALIYIHPQPFSSLHPETKRVGSWQAGIVLQQNGFSIRTINRSSYHVTEFKSNFRIRVVFTACIYNVFMQPPGFG